MGMLVEGRWRDDEGVSAMQNKKGAFVRADSRFREWVRADGSTPFPPESGRYALLVAHNCPWAHRTLICRNLKGLQGAIAVQVAETRRDAEGWWFPQGFAGLQPRDGRLHLHRLYAAADPAYTGRVTVPVLWDLAAGRIVNNESSEIIRMLNGEFPAHGAEGPHLYPPHLRVEIDAVNERVYADVNNGVYRCGFAGSQQAYEEAVARLFDTLDELEARLDRRRYLAGDDLTEADVRLFPTLVRFDPVYYGHFKCNLRRIADYANLSGYLRDLYQMPAFRETVRVEAYKQGYYGNSPRLNPSGIIPKGPLLDWDAAHDRATRPYPAQGGGVAK